MLRRTLALSMAFVLGTAGCAHSTSSTADAAARCRAEGGEWRAATMLIETCVRPASDAGLACTDDAQCQGLCIPGDDAYIPSTCARDVDASTCSKRKRLRAKAGDALRGVCATTRRDVLPANCASHIVDGRLVIEGCAD